MDIIRTVKSLPGITKLLINRYAPFRGAGISIDTLDLNQGFVRVKMPLTRQNRNIVGVQFGGSLYAMVDPFYMLLLLHLLGNKYIVWDKSATINFLSPGRGTVYAEIRIDAAEIRHIEYLAANNSPILRVYKLDIIDETGQRIAEVEKTIYIRRKKATASRSLFKSR
ncbi:DUF4442 domain-containing protein [Acinetobacter populi]|uniref:DUF4442 domain-containing protein n=1 Tax=Acinetobacter populi TaxID=1582270 RepID=A0A1Z9Z3G7_9GAMM|nr:DUF4442 domain-containing protein [Acinetobacter populi]OUY09000.1 DUF4442 domain-containing protein [Acinetobacter populi]